MKKLIKFILILVVVLGMMTAGIGYALKPTDEIKKDQRLWNIEDNLNVASLNSDFLKNASISGDNIETRVTFDNDMFNKILKYAFSQSGTTNLDESAFVLDGKNLIVKHPIQIGIWNSQADVYSKLYNEDGKVVFDIEQVKIGKITVPKSIVSSQIKNIVHEDTDGIRVEDNKIYLDIKSSNVNLKKVDINDSKIDLSLYFTKENLIKIKNDVVDSLLRQY
ncbi:hypothetical protein [Peptostreptococcus faecalis]|uniref:hypothetical protein n=1 Tax=Peptostreptococcus faecalis TaxID=2045015 RepID=UPI000C7BCD9C|nr:hypothetical protein [Peptostreptococcus faecalis]